MIKFKGIKNFKHKEKNNGFYSCEFDSDLYDCEGNKKGVIHLDVPNFYLNEKGEIVACADSKE